MVRLQMKWFDEVGKSVVVWLVAVEKGK